MNVASFGNKFSKAFAVVSQSGFRVQEADTLEQAEEIVGNTLRAHDSTCAIYGEGECNRVAIYHYQGSLAR